MAKSLISDLETSAESVLDALRGAIRLQVHYVAKHKAFIPVLPYGHSWKLDLSLNDDDGAACVRINLHLDDEDWFCAELDEDVQRKRQGVVCHVSDFNGRRARVTLTNNNATLTRMKFHITGEMKEAAHHVCVDPQVILPPST